MFCRLPGFRGVEEPPPCGRIQPPNPRDIDMLSIRLQFRTRRLLPTLLVLLLAPAVSVCAAQDPVATPVTEEERSAVIERVAVLLEERYVFPELGARLADSLRVDERRQAFSDIRDPHRLAQALSERIRSLSGDGHLWLMVQEEPEPAGRPEPGAESGPSPQQVRANFGFPRAKILPGNVAYLDVRQFFPPEVSGPTAAAAMAYVGNAEALLLDLRRSMGGSQSMVALLASYFLEEEPRIHLWDSYHRPDDRTEEYWTADALPGPRFIHGPVYVLTSPTTFSAGEGLAYLLKHLGRATVVGDTTGGGAHPGSFHRVNSRFTMFVAESRAIVSTTGDNWEGRGVRPDVPVPSSQARGRAHLLALEYLRDHQEDAGRRQELEEIIGGLLEPG
jgi:retinol-binding protein 3